MGGWIISGLAIDPCRFAKLPHRIIVTEETMDVAI